MSHLFVSASSTPRHGGRPRLAGLAGAVAAVLIPVFALTIRPSQRPVEDAPRHSDAGRRPSAPAEARR